MAPFLPIDRSSKDTIMNACGYIRVSTEDQAREGLSVEYQEAKIRAYGTGDNACFVHLTRSSSNLHLTMYLGVLLPLEYYSEKDRSTNNSVKNH